MFVMLFEVTKVNAARIEFIKADVTSETALPPMVKERMNESVAAIGEQLIIGRELPFSDDWRKQQESTIHLVFDKILVGYTVKQVNIKTDDSTAIIEVKLLPWVDVIKDIKVNLYVEGMPPELEKIVRNDLTLIKDIFNDGLNGLPIAAQDWTNGILKRQLNKFMETALPEFRADFDVKIQTNVNTSAIIDLTVYPKLPVVRTINLSMRSDTMPNIALVTHRTLMESKSNILIGVPVAFIERHKEEIQNLLAKPLDEQKDFRALKIKSRVTINVAEQADIMIRSDSTRYRMRASGWVDVGRSNKVNDDLLFRIHLGRKISNKDEAFFQFDLKPQNVKFNSAVGYLRNVFKNTDASLRYDFNEKNFITAFEYEFLKDWLLRYEHKFSNDHKEAAIRYKLHDFLGIECVVDNDEGWIRFIGNF